MEDLAGEELDEDVEDGPEVVAAGELLGEVGVDAGVARRPAEARDVARRPDLPRAAARDAGADRALMEGRRAYLPTKIGDLDPPNEVSQTVLKMDIVFAIGTTIFKEPRFFSTTNIKWMKSREAE